MVTSLATLVFAVAATGFGTPADTDKADKSSQRWLLTAEWMDIRDRDVRPFPTPQHSHCLILFVGTDCPIANVYQPTIRDLAKAYVPRRVAVIEVNPVIDTTLDEARQHALEYGITVPVVLDKEQKIARRLGARMTPEAFLISRDGEVVYRGRIDNLYAAFGRKRARPTRHDLKEALDAVLKGRPIFVAETKSVGCFIHYPKPRDAAPAESKGNAKPAEPTRESR